MQLSDVASLTPLTGGWSGLTFRGEVSGEVVVVRVYPPGLRPERAPEVDAALHRLVRGLVPVPEVLEVVPGDAAADRPGLLLTRWVDGVRGDVVLPRLLEAGDDAGLQRAGRALGSVAATLAGVPTLRAGVFVDADLAIGPLADLGVPDGLAAWVEDRLGPLPGWAPLLEPLRDVVAEAEERLEAVGRTCLVHGDLNPKNVLLDPDSLEAVALVDWEFAHAGHPATDLGNLLRLDRHPAWVDGVLGAWTERHPVPREEALLLARSADLWALVDLAARAGDNPVADRAAALLAAIAATGDVTTPPPAPVPGRA